MFTRKHGREKSMDTDRKNQKKTRLLSTFIVLLSAVIGVLIKLLLFSRKSNSEIDQEIEEVEEQITEEIVIKEKLDNEVKVIEIAVTETKKAKAKRDEKAKKFFKEVD